jgi:hypothetical protein
LIATESTHSPEPPFKAARPEGKWRNYRLRAAKKMTPEFSLPQRRIHAAVGHPARPGHLLLRRAAYIVFLSAVPFGSFFVTLWLTEPQMPSANNSQSERLAAYPISNSSDLAKSTSEAGLVPSQQLSGHVDAIYRIDEQKVDLPGWSADRQGRALEVRRGRLRRAPTPVLAEIQVDGSADAITIEARDTSVEDILAALSRAFDMDYRSSIDLDKRLYGTYVGPLSRVVTRILQGYNFVLKNNNGSISVTVVGTPISLAANPVLPGLPAPAHEPQQSGVPAPELQQSAAPAPIPQQSGAPAPAPVPQQSGAPAPAPVPQGLGSPTTPAPEAASPAAPVVGPKF